MALYTDRAHWAFHTPQAKGPVDKTQLTQVGRALERLGIEHIPAYSPQARGRSERLNRTFQDRLVNELRVAGHDRGRGQSLSPRSLLPDYNATFAAPRPIRRVRSSLGSDRSRADPLSRRGARRGTRQHRDLRRPRVSARPATRPAILHGPARDDSPTSGRRVLHLVGRTAAGSVSGSSRAPARPSDGGAARGSCRSRGRQERAHRSLENAQNAFSTAPTGLS